MEFLLQYGLFLAEVVTVVVAVAVIVSIVVGLGQRTKHEEKPVLTIQRLNDLYDDYEDQLNANILNKLEYKQLCKQKEAQLKAKEKSEKNRLKKKTPVADSSLTSTQNEQPTSVAQAQSSASSQPRKKRVYVLEFEGDIKASGVNDLARSVTAVLMVADPEYDEVLVKLESSGGLVHSYGLAAAQLERIRARSIDLTVAIDRVAASGGYMMAAVANKVIAAPFAIIGSIGVVAQIPNFNRLLKKHEVDLELHTAGQYKRTLTLFGENTQEGREKFKEEINETHELFKNHLRVNRPSLDLETVATGEHWYGTQALSLSLIDKLMTSDEYIATAVKEAEVFEVSFELKKSVADRLFNIVGSRLQSTLGQLLPVGEGASKVLGYGSQEHASFSRVRVEADHS